MPMPLLALAFIAGIGLTYQFAVLPSLAAVSGLALVAIVAWTLRVRALAVLVAGVVLSSAQGHRALAQDWPCGRDKERLSLTGLVASAPERLDGRIDFDFEPGPDARRTGVPGRVRLSWYRPQAVPAPGETWRLTATLRCRNGFANPGGYDRELHLLRHGYGATGYVSGTARRIEGEPASRPVERLRARIASGIEAAAGRTRSAGVLVGLAVGLRGGMDRAIRDAFVATGTAHLIAISGMHVTAFAAVALLGLRSVYRFGAGAGLSAAWPAAQAVVVASLTLGYGLLAGASLPTVRTMAMVGLILLLRTARRHAQLADVLAVSALLLTAADPSAATSAGFWLSYVAVAALLSVVRAGAGSGRVLREFVRAQAVVTVVLAPVLVAAFGGVPLLGPVANAIAIPLFSLLLLPATLAGTLLLFLAPGLAGRWWAAFGVLLDRAWPPLEWLAGRPHAVLYPTAAPGWLLGASLVLAVLAILVPGRALRLPAAAVIVALLFRQPVVPPPGGFDLVVLDVGHGLAAVLRTATHVLLFDTGPRWRSGASAAGVTLTPYLRAVGVSRVDRVVASHADADHAGGLERLRHDFVVASVIGDAGSWQPVDRACEAGMSWRWDGVDFEVMHPPAGAVLPRNDSSCAVRVSGPGGSALLLADPEAVAEAALAARAIRADAVIVPHHGSASSSSPALVEAVHPRWALVSAGFGNRWGLPRAPVVARWRHVGATLRSTAEGGALRLEFRPGVAAGPIRAWRESEPRWWRRR